MQCVNYPSERWNILNDILETSEKTPLGIFDEILGTYKNIYRIMLLPLLKKIKQGANTSKYGKLYLNK